MRLELTHKLVIAFALVAGLTMGLPLLLGALGAAPWMASALALLCAMGTGVLVSRWLARNFRRALVEQLQRAADQVAESSRELSLSSQGLGAIIAIERGVGLRNYASSGIPIDARLSYELLMSLFHPRSPLHESITVNRNWPRSSRTPESVTS